ncbi:MAG: hypothetical protein ACOC53_06465, partial [Candidatus Saliniplasma sp.]
LDGSSYHDKRLDLTYDAVGQSWEGDGITGSYSDYSWSNGKGDGGDGGLRSEDDGKVEFRIHTDAEVSPSEQEELANTYSPVMYFHEDEEHFPREIQEFLDDSDLKRKNFLGSDPTIVSKSVSTSDLATYTSDNYYLDWDGEEPDDEEYVIYSHVFTATDNKIVIQYWFFYLNNGGNPYTDWAVEHEGDWEMIQIICDQNGNPEKVGYSWHYEMRKSDWTSGNLRKEGSHPIVYVEKGGHASNFNQYTASWNVDPEKYNDRNDWNDYSVIPISNENWLNFRGKWGEDGGSPNSPTYRYSKHGSLGIYQGKLAHMWIEPIYWYDVSHKW